MKKQIKTTQKTEQTGGKTQKTSENQSVKGCAKTDEKT